MSSIMYVSINLVCLQLFESLLFCLKSCWTSPNRLPWSSRLPQNCQNCQTTTKNMFNPHQSCGHSDIPLARIHRFYTAGSRKGLEGVDNSGHLVTTNTERKLSLGNRHFFIIEKCVRDNKNRVKRLFGSCGIDNEAHWSCKRSMTEHQVDNFVQNWSL